MDSQRQSKLTLGVVVAAAVVVVALVIALIVAMTSGGDDEGGTASPPSTTSPEAGPEPAPSTEDETTDVDPLGRPVTVVDSASGTPRGQTGEPGGFPDGQEMVGAPEGLELQRVSSGTTVMVSTSDGPTRVDDGVMTGYAHSPRGAALTAANFMGLGMEMGSAYADFLTHFMPDQVADDPEFIDEIRSRGASVDGRALMAAEGYMAPRWFRFGQCDENFCTVEAAMPSISEAIGEVESGDVDPQDHTVMRVSMKWADDQWEIVSAQPLAPVRDIDGSWSPWS